MSNYTIIGIILIIIGIFLVILGIYLNRPSYGVVMDEKEGNGIVIGASEPEALKAVENNVIGSGEIIGIGLDSNSSGGTENKSNFLAPPPK